jgi:2-amino-4-hydroxy-6-hydroxymethyldihydropteridine diphosphokinase
MIAFVGLGSNLGDREAHLRAALDAMDVLPETRVVRVSPFYDTEPVGEVEQPNFLNGVALLETRLPARQLLWNLMLIEKRLGRVRSVRWGPRAIDLDLLLLDDQVVEEPGLQLPHPELTRRSFVLVPLADLDPTRVHPVTGETIAAHLSKLKVRPPVKHGSRIWN